jgi:hypothetical protein
MIAYFALRNNSEVPSGLAWFEMIANTVDYPVAYSSVATGDEFGELLSRWQLVT